MRENISQYSLNPEGHYVLTLKEVSERIPTPKTFYRKWLFSYDENGTQKEFSIIIFPWKSKELLLALGGTLVGGNTVDWEEKDVIGKVVDCDLIHEEDYQGDMREELTNVVAVEDAVHISEPPEETEWGSE